MQKEIHKKNQRTFVLLSHFYQFKSAGNKVENFIEGFVESNKFEQDISNIMYTSFHFRCHEELELGL